MGNNQRLAILGTVLGCGAALFMLGQAMATEPTLVGMTMGILTLAFSGFGYWGGVLTARQSSRATRPLLGATIGGLVAADMLFIPAALAFAISAYLNWRANK